ncbi:tRNA epoxyqueuosine(34) reductase QueG [Tengunoibacter tsumagoiensis]|uniref:Epoxyqueuosine reductase n=1 Tax=Tengunoibacter tsumagoiensis TaxID=2014871 RepID=A0A401ZWX9_9CHLR|nr:tRNA epoxyqueuosine(34) reductase QueG [Tengunoibacter tsumagoiensis]GCE11316.1 epoxyqueuosine reductase [Tengunoibacter tsumagoiensis]
MLETQTIKDYAYSLGFDLVRVTTALPFREANQAIKDRVSRGYFAGLPWFSAERADVSCDPTALLPEAQSIIALGMCYLTEQPDEGGPLQGRISRYAWGEDYHDLIKPKLQQFTTWINEAVQERPGELPGERLETRLFVDTGRMVDRAVAQRAGLGWYGKNTNILTKGWGSWVFLAEIVTNLPLIPDEPLKSNCGNCEICLHACPTGALPHPYELDSTRCISFLTIELKGSIPIELRPLMGNLIFGCDICQEVCPVNQVAERRLGLRDEQGAPLIGLTTIKRRSTDKPAFQGRTEFQTRPPIGTTPELIPLLALTEEEFRLRFRHSPIKRTKRRGFLRNVCVALGNSGDRSAVPALRLALQDEEPLIRGHAAWALGRLGGDEALQALQAAMAQEADQEVRQEVRYALSLLNAL